MSRASRRHPTAMRPAVSGFTLLELLIGLTLIGFIMVLLFGGLRLGTRSWDAGEARLATSSRMGVVASFLQRELGNAYPMRFPSEKGGVELAFSGEADQIRFAGFLPPHVGLAGLHLIDLGTDQDGGEDGGRLVMRWQRANQDTLDFSALEDAKKVVLMSRVREIALAYFGAETSEAEPAWHEQWHHATQLPTLIRLRLTLDSGEAWPDIVVAPMIVANQDPAQP